MRKAPVDLQAHCSEASAASLGVGNKGHTPDPPQQNSTAVVSAVDCAAPAAAHAATPAAAPGDALAVASAAAPVAAHVAVPAAVPWMASCSNMYARSVS